jgi:thioredoxin-related protein
LAALSIAFAAFSSATFAEPVPSAPKGETSLSKASDLNADAAAARQARLPILLLYSLPGCPYCEAIRRGHLTPMSAEVKPRAIIRQLDLNAATPLRDFNGRLTTHGDFVRSRGVKFAPVVAFVDSDGNALGDPLVGTMLPDFYGAYLEDALVAATAKVRLKSVLQPPAADAQSIK